MCDSRGIEGWRNRENENGFYGRFGSEVALMKQKQLELDQGFHVVFDNQESQVAEMTLAAGGVTGGPGHRHRNSDS